MVSLSQVANVIVSIILRTVFSINVTIKVGVILIEELPEPFDLRRVGPTLSIAFEHIEKDFGIKFNPVYRNYTGLCPWEPPLGILAELYYHDNIKALIGPACSQGLESSARLAQYLRLPMASGLGDLALRDYPTDMFKTLTKLSYNIKKISYSMSAIMLEYEWRHSAIIYDESYIFSKVVGEYLVLDFQQVSALERPYDIPFNPSKQESIKKLLQEANGHARVFIIICKAELFRTLMFDAYELGLANGDYVFITLELFQSSWMGYYRQFTRGDFKDAGVTRAYESVLIVTLTQPDTDDLEFVKFSDEVKRRALQQYGYKFGEKEKVTYFITAFYDSALYLANVYNITIAEGGDLDDGMAVAQRLWNSSFQGITGPVAIDETGDRVADFDVLDMTSPVTKEFKMVGRFLGANQRYSTSRDVEWPRGLPRDEPVCGFTGEKCIEHEIDQSKLATLVTSLLAAASASILVVVLVAYRKIRLRHERGLRNWIIDPDEIVIRKGGYADSVLSRSMRTLKSHNSSIMEQTFTEVGYCRSQTVAIRKLKLKTLTINKQQELEFYEMQRTTHANLAKFVGACVKPDHLRLLMEYCPRGSLQDILHNDSIELDWNFRYSLIYDVIKGMQYLHAHTVHVHGRLASTNCVIDSRFMLKLTDFGLHTIFSLERQEEKQKSWDLFCKKLLWTAPEHLRQLETTDGVGYSQTGDVYSFSIILQEIVARAEPYEENCLRPTEIIATLMERNANVLRPKVTETEFPSDLLNLMKRCWNENPTGRPNFTSIEQCFRQLRAGKSTNIMDNLLQRMSQYADNLESLAAERTKQYLDEKQRAEQLLHRLLPQSVARQLERGDAVIPELFQCVSIYFSDIVGFTTLAAASSPIQVVSFLNDLFTKFDQAVYMFDVYKVETIGDAYMVVSGLPERNGDNHIAEIAGMALKIMDLVKRFEIKHMKEDELRIRVGIHSGPVVAGVVGQTMPRYCLFGDTVNTASRMESTSQPLKIQLTESANQLLELFPQFLTSERGEIDIKGKGTMTTYWLTGSVTSQMSETPET